MDQAPDDLPPRLVGAALPPVLLPSTGGGLVNLAALRAPRTVLYCYPRTSEPGRPAPSGWDVIPGARGCTPQSCAFRDHHRELAALGADVFGLSTQPTAYQREMAERLHLPFAVLSDERCELAGARYPHGEDRLPVLIGVGDLSGARTSAVKIRGRLDGDHHRG